MQNEIAPYFDYTLLRPDATLDQILKMFEEAEQAQFAAVCFPAYFVRDVYRKIGESSKVKLCTVAGFPLGYSAVSSKVEEIKRAVDEGADEVDAVINLAAYRCGQKNYFENDLQSMIRAAHLKGKNIKVILESNMMSQEEMLDISLMAKEMGASFIKTGTGFFGPTKLETVRFLKNNLPAGIHLKAAGGIKTLAEAQAMVKAGADRIGSSNAMSILAEMKNQA